MKTNIKKTIACKGINQFQINEFLTTTHLPKAGDVAIFEVLSLGKHKRIQATDGKARYIFPGDRIMAAFGNRYASAQFEGYLPSGIQTEFHILGMGGAIGLVESTHSKFRSVGPTRLRLIGYATDEKGVINTKYYYHKGKWFNREESLAQMSSKIILSIGSSMDSGKTTTAGYLCRGIKQAGKRVAFIKLTGTVYSKDADFARDCGADLSLDFSHFGYPSTYMEDLPELMKLYENLLHAASAISPEYIVVEIADGIMQRETKALLTHPGFMGSIHQVIFSCGDSLAASGGMSTLSAYNITPLALAGLFTASPLMIQEVKDFCALPVLTLADLAKPEILNLLAGTSPERKRTFPVETSFNGLVLKRIA
ncbi:MAG: hypothetical protein AAGI38_10665 [Bacteroidota bacterium]